MTDKQVIDIQTEAKPVVQQPTKQPGTDAVSGTRQIDTPILAGRIGTGQRGKQRFLRIEKEGVPQTGIVCPTFLLGEVVAALEVVRR